jgi:hypothetical protein
MIDVSIPLLHHKRRQNCGLIEATFARKLTGRRVNTL